MKKLTHALAAIFLVAIFGGHGTGTAHARGYVNDYRAWMSLSPDARAAYVQGMNDSLNYVFMDDTLAEALVKKGRTQCLIDLKLSAASLAERISFVYGEQRNTGFPPTVIYIVKMAEICKIYIDRERASFGLGPS